MKVNDGRNERILTQKERGYFKWKRSKVSNATKKPRTTETEQIYHISQL